MGSDQQTIVFFSDTITNMTPITLNYVPIYEDILYDPPNNQTSYNGYIKVKVIIPADVLAQYDHIKVLFNDSSFMNPAQSASITSANVDEYVEVYFTTDPMTLEISIVGYNDEQESDSEVLFTEYVDFSKLNP